jgi:Fic family protein
VSDTPGERHSVPEKMDLETDPGKIAELESHNAIAQFDFAAKLIATHTTERGGVAKRFRLRASMVLDMQRYAVAGIQRDAGQWRNVGMSIFQSNHAPPAHERVAELVEDLCDYINDNWSSATALHLAAYCLWRLNWIHPFSDGNGRTSRVLSYVVMSVKLNGVIPGVPTFPDRIAANKNPYYIALEAADDADKAGRIDTSSLEQLLAAHLSAQLTDYARQAGIKIPSG